MAETPNTIRVTHDELSTSIIRTGQKLIELGMQLREGFDVHIDFEVPDGVQDAIDVSGATSSDSSIGGA